MMRDVQMELGRAIRFIDGAPDITGLPCDKIESEEAGEYMRRYHLEFSRDRCIRFHHILTSDPEIDLHDHPWDFASVMLAGSYVEITPDGPVTYEAPCVITRTARQLHRLVLAEPVWTYVICGKVQRKWGFATDHGWVPWDQHGNTRDTSSCGNLMHLTVREKALIAHSLRATAANLDQEARSHRFRHGRWAEHRTALHEEAHELRELAERFENGKP